MQLGGDVWHLDMQQAAWTRTTGHRTRSLICRAKGKGKNRGAAYYERYLANRAKRGGIFLPPSDSNAGLPPLLGPDRGAAAAAEVAAALGLHQSGFATTASAAATSAAATSAASGVNPSTAVSSPWPVPPQPQLVDPCVLQLLEQYRVLPPPPKQRPAGHLDPAKFSDYVRDERKRARLGARLEAGTTHGVVVSAPRMPQSTRQLQLPPLPGTQDTALNRVHVFWDVDSVHPGAADPRVAASALRQLAGSYGQVEGIYAYGIRRQFSWVPEAFLRAYAPQRLPGAAKRQQQRQQEQWQQEQLELLGESDASLGGSELQGKLTSELEPGGRGAPVWGLSGRDQEQQGTAGDREREERPGADVGAPQRLVCPACGARALSYKSLQQHMGNVHKQRAPPLAKLRALAAAAEEGGGGPAAMWDGGTLNTSTRTLGRVAAYFNCRGQLFVPQPGLQISLKYALMHEGVEVRLVGNHKRDVVGTLAAAALAWLRDEVASVWDASSSWVGRGGQDVLMLVTENEAAASKVLREARRVGVAALVVCATPGVAGVRDGGSCGWGPAFGVVGWHALLAGQYGDALAGAAAP